MSQENVEIVRKLFDATARRDTESVLSIYHPDVEWDGSRHPWSQVLPGKAVFRGHQELRAWARRYYETWENLDDTIEELIDAGDQVISIVSTRGRGRLSGIDVDWQGNAGIWTIRNGKVVRVVWFRSREEALEAVGLSESGS
jgi:ketosteroid isomerase-like protein